MTEQLLRNSLNEAQKKAQDGLLIWANWNQWDDHASDLKLGNENYDFALSQIAKGEEATIKAEWNGLYMPSIIAVSVQKLLSSNDFFNHVLKVCKDGHYEGPITLVPANQLVESC
ncbi:MAG: hypothetical protein K2H53_00070 [Clostridia bacterium]|nr:hypothetical protein [Clostridia bacterium]